MNSIHESQLDPVAGVPAAWPMAKRIAFRFAFVFAGTWKGRPAAFTLEKINVPPTLLMSRGVHWVQEHQFNR